MDRHCRLGKLGLGVRSVGGFGFFTVSESAVRCWIQQFGFAACALGGGKLLAALASALGGGFCWGCAWQLLSAVVVSSRLALLDGFGWLRDLITCRAV